MNERWTPTRRAGKDDDDSQETVYGAAGEPNEHEVAEQVGAEVDANRGEAEVAAGADAQAEPVEVAVEVEAEPVKVESEADAKLDASEVEAATVEAAAVQVDSKAEPKPVKVSEAPLMAPPKLQRKRHLQDRIVEMRRAHIAFCFKLDGHAFLAQGSFGCAPGVQSGKGGISSGSCRPCNDLNMHACSDPRCSGRPRHERHGAL